MYGKWDCLVVSKMGKKARDKGLAYPSNLIFARTCIQSTTKDTKAKPWLDNLEPEEPR